MRPCAFLALVTLGSKLASGGTHTHSSTINNSICALANATYCAGGSLQTDILIHCNDGTAISISCNEDLAGVPPVGIKGSALCYQSSDTAGDAACSLNGMIYGMTGLFPIPTSVSTVTFTLPVLPPLPSLTDLVLTLTNAPPAVSVLTTTITANPTVDGTPTLVTFATTFTIYPTPVVVNGSTFSTTITPPFGSSTTSTSASTAFTVQPTTMPYPPLVPTTTRPVPTVSSGASETLIRKALLFGALFGIVLLVL